MQPTNIPWADVVWNPVVGCSPASEGCLNCYARELHNKRHAAYKAGKLQNCPQYAQPFEKIQLLRDRLDQPLRTRTPKRIFVNSMSDLFHKDVPLEFIDEVMEMAITADQHTYIILTKRIERVLEYDKWRENNWLSKPYSPWQDNIWLLVSVEDQKTADERIPLLLQTPAAVRGVSVEPMLGVVDLTRVTCPVRLDEPASPGIVCGTVLGRDRYRSGFCPGHAASPGLDWVICGGESGPNRRSFDVQWARDLKDQCVAAGVPFFYKQGYDHNPDGLAYTGFKTMPLLDGRVWDQIPQRKAVKEQEVPDENE